MDILKEVPAHCPKCDKDVSFKIEMCYVSYNGIIPCLECPECNTICPDYAFDRFIQTGEIIIGV